MLMIRTGLRAAIPAVLLGALLGVQCGDHHRRAGK